MDYGLFKILVKAEHVKMETKAQSQFPPLALPLRYEG